MFEFTKLRQEEPFQTLMDFNNDGEVVGFPEQVVMYSGGLDSLGGAVEEAVNQKRRVVLVNHRATPKLDKRYATLQGLLTAQAPNNPLAHVRVTMHKKKWMNLENTQRSRSFLYIAIGAAIAEMLGQSSCPLLREWRNQPEPADMRPGRRCQGNANNSPQDHSWI